MSPTLSSGGEHNHDQDDKSDDYIGTDDAYHGGVSPEMQQTFGRVVLQSCPTQSC